MYEAFEHDSLRVLTDLHKFTDEAVEEAHELWAWKLNFLL